MERVNPKECGPGPPEQLGRGGEVGTLTSTLDAPLLMQRPPAPLHVPEWTLLSESSSHKGKHC